MRLALVEEAKEHDRFIKSLPQHPFNLYSSVMVLCALYVYVDEICAINVCGSIGKKVGFC